MTAADAALAAPLSRTRFALLLFGCWLLAAAIMVATHWHDIITLAYPDPDDQLRLVEVRDFLGGQSWWDVSQHRLNPPAGGPMHWSRLVDLPIAFVELVLRPLAGTAGAQTAAAVIVPLCTMGFAMLTTAWLTRRLIEREAAVIAALLVISNPAALQQMQPLRVDHHGWQIGLAVAVTIALIDGARRRSGIVAGLLLALWLRISLEGLPFAAAAGALVGLRWALCRGREEDARLIGFFAALAGGSALLFAALIPLHEWPVAWCDSISAPQLGMFVVAALGAPLLAWLPPRPIARLVAGAALALAALVALQLAAPRCGLNAFSDLPPLARTIWYDNVLEGLPLWRQATMTIALAIGYPLVGLAGGAIAWRRAAAPLRARWAAYLFLLGATVAATVLVQRVGGTANLLALPGGVYLLFTTLRRARAIAAPARRLLATVAALLLFAPPTPAMAVKALIPEKDPAATAKQGGDCATTRNLRLLDAMPPGRMLAPLDLGPGILLQSRHSILAASYHRSGAAIEQAIRAFTGTPDAARAIVQRHGIGYVALCTAAAETDVYRRYAPRGFAAQLARGVAPPWLSPLPLDHSGVLRLWRVNGPIRPRS